MKKNYYALFIIILLPYLSFSQDIELEIVASGFSSPVCITNANDNRLFIVEQSGYIQILNSDNSVNSTPFLDIDSNVLSGGERGLLGLAFHPDFNSNGYFFVNYTNNSGATTISRFSVSSDPDIADPSSEVVLLNISQPFSNHNGGDIAFGPDGYLYIGTGDGGSGGDPGDRAQNLNTLLGKMLRIDVDNGSPYSIPPDNPYVSESTALDEIWAIGLRNPWRFSFDSQTGDLWIADVGQNAIEEINLVSSNEAGVNYGWRCYEGNSTYNTSGNCPSDTNELTFPVAQYPHSGSGPFKCSITGGYIHRGTEQPNLNGWYFFADYCSDEIGILKPNGSNWDMTFTEQFSGNGWTSFGEDNNGELYITGNQSGNVYKLIDVNLSIDSNDINQTSLFPNPTDKTLTIKSVQKINSLNIYNLQGKAVKSMNEIHNNSLNISIENLDSGFYILELLLKNGTKTISKFIKK